MAIQSRAILAVAALFGETDPSPVLSQALRNAGQPDARQASEVPEGFDGSGQVGLSTQ